MSRLKLLAALPPDSPDLAAPPNCPAPTPRRVAELPREARLMVRVRDRWRQELIEACRYSSVPEAFLGALVANESGGNPQAKRFEPAVYRHLRRLAEGQAARYGAVTLISLERELADMLRPKADSYHAAHLSDAFAAANSSPIAALADEALRELATSWGLTQIMGYHMVGRPGTARDLLEPRLHFRVALELLAQFAQRFQLDLRREFSEMFRCWNTGQPYGATTDPAYVEKGLRRMEIYVEIQI